MSCYERLDLVAEKERIDDAVRRASKDFAENFAIVAMPKGLVGPFVHGLNSSAMDVQILDDGEDDGVPSMVVVPSSSAVSEHLAGLRRGVWWSVFWFVAVAVLAVALAALQAGSLAVSLSLIFLAFNGGGLYVAHQRWERTRRLRDDVRAKGL